MLTDEQLIDDLTAVFERDTRAMTPRADLQASVHAALARPGGRPTRWLLAVIPAAVALAVVALALVLIHRGQHEANRSAAPKQHPTAPVVTRPRVFAPAGQSPWALLAIHVPGTRACVGVTVLVTIHPPTARGSLGTACAVRDARGHAFLTRFARELPTRVGGKACAPGACQPGNYRDVGFGLLGPDAVSITYRDASGTLQTEATGPDGAYLIVQPVTRRTCVALRAGGATCVRGMAEIRQAALTAAGVTRVTYRDGTVCRLPGPRLGAVLPVGCPQVGIVPKPTAAYIPPHVAPAQVSTTVAARPVPARRYCASNRTGVTIPCDRSVPPGYTAEPVHRNAPDILLNIRFIARLAADNNHSGYEWLIEPVGRHRCTRQRQPSGIEGTTTDPIQAGRQFLQQVSISKCPGRYDGLVSYQPDRRAGPVALGPGLTIHDHSVLVGRFSYTIR